MENNCIIWNAKNEVVGQAPLNGNLYVLQVLVHAEEHVCVSTINASDEHGLAIGSMSPCASIETWHQRLGHTHYEAIHTMINKNLIRGMDILPGTKEPSSVCKPCVEGKHVCTPIPKETSTCTDTVLGCIFSNVWGPATVTTPSKEQYYVLFIDDKSCWMCLTHKE
jgi:GAG-pre-integrase domain